MNREHPVWQFLTQKEALGMTPEQMYDKIMTFAATNTVIKQLNRIEERINMSTSVLSRLQSDSAALLAQLTAMQTAQTSMAQALAAANARLQASITALLDNAGSGNAAALTAIAESLESSLSGYQAITQQMQTSATAEAGVDLLSITPTSAVVATGGTVSFSASVPATFSATSGSFAPGTGNYTAPSDPTITTDTVTAVSADGTQTVTASVSITAPPPAPPAAPVAAAPATTGANNAVNTTAAPAAPAIKTAGGVAIST